MVEIMYKYLLINKTKKRGCVPYLYNKTDAGNSLVFYNLKNLFLLGFFLKPFLYLQQKIDKLLWIGIITIAFVAQHLSFMV